MENQLEMSKYISITVGLGENGNVVIAYILFCGSSYSGLNWMMNLLQPLKTKATPPLSSIYDAVTLNCLLFTDLFM